MTTKTEFIRARIKPDLKLSVQKILDKIGLTQTEAINLFYNQILMYDGLPFEVRVPNSETIRAINDARKGKMTTYNNFSDFMDDMTNEAD